MNNLPMILQDKQAMLHHDASLSVVKKLARSKERYEAKIRKPIQVCTEPYECDRIKTIAELVAKDYEIDPLSIKTRCRSSQYRQPRQIVQYLAYVLFKKEMTLQYIAEHTGLTDHSTVINSREKITDYIYSYPKWEEKINRYLSELKDIFSQPIPEVQPITIQ